MKRLEDLTPDPNNANAGSRRGAAMIAQSLEAVGACRSIVATADGVVFAGSQTLDAAVECGLRARFVETDGNELVVVVRRDLKYGDPRVHEAALADNRARDVSSGAWEPRVLSALADRLPMQRYFYGTELADIAAGVARDRERDARARIKAGPRVCPTCGRPWKGEKREAGHGRADHRVERKAKARHRSRARSGGRRAR